MDLDVIASRIKAGLWTFSKLVFNSNNDLPYHDYYGATEQTTETSYVVGTNNKDARGTQSKLFVSKSTLIYATEDQTIRFNNRNNTPITILANTWYTFVSNIYQVFFVVPSADKKLYLYFEGVLPEEARTPE